MTTTVTATDPSGGSAIQCFDSAGGLNQGPLTVTGPTTATVQISVSGDGQHFIFCSATDTAGNTGLAPDSTASGVIQIDTNPPAMTCSVNPSTLWSPNHEMIDVTATVTAEDEVSGPAEFALVSVTSSEPDPSDIAGFTTGTADVTGQLRSGRAGNGPGRVYTLTYRAADGSRQHQHLRADSHRPARPRQLTHTTGRGSSHGSPPRPWVFPPASLRDCSAALTVRRRGRQRLLRPGHTR